MGERYISHFETKAFFWKGRGLRLNSTIGRGKKTFLTIDNLQVSDCKEKNLSFKMGSEGARGHEVSPELISI